MRSDKNSEILEQQLKTLGQKIRIDILKNLNHSDDSITFSMLQKRVIGVNPKSKNFSFHLNVLKKRDLITSREGGYLITVLGKQILKNILNIEQILNRKNKPIMIRTSKYSKEPFDGEKIKDYLIREGDLEDILAKKIAQKVRERLSTTKIEYLTTPLMREYINGILLESGLENVRRKLTRLGTPPYEAFKYFENNNNNPEDFIKKVGYDVSEQFLLLNLLPNELADLYLSGEVILLHLNYWGLRPLSIYLNADAILDLISKHYLKDRIKIDTTGDLVKLILNFIDLLNRFKFYLSEDLLIGDFNKIFLSLFDNRKKEEISYAFEILSSQILRYNEQFKNCRKPLSLEFCYGESKSEKGLSSNQIFIDNLFLKTLDENLSLNEGHVNPVILLDYNNLYSSNLNSFIMNGLNSSNLRDDIIFYNNKSSNLINSSIIKILNSKHPKLNYRMILDKILINLHYISLEANQNDDLFYELLQEKLNSVFELFKHKESLIKKKLNSLKGWEGLLSGISEKNLDVSIRKSLKSISFFGLNKAVKEHCGIELDRLETSEIFALKILSFLNQIIEEKNNQENEFFILSQPHEFKYFGYSLDNDLNRLENLNRYSSRIIRKDTTLPLKKQILLFKKFEEIIGGGCKFDYSCDSDTLLLEEQKKVLLTSNLNAFSIN